MSVLTLLGRLHDDLTKAGYHAACLALIIMFGAYTVEVFGRYLFNAPQWWASEAVSYSLCIGAFLMMPYVTMQRGHVAVGLIFNVLPKRAVVPMLRFTVAMGVIACALAAWITLDETVRQFSENVHIMAVKPVPKYLISIFIPFGLISSAIHFLRMLFARDLDPGQTAGAGQG